jgi:hypothetical protein
MALSSSSLKTKIKNEIIALFGAATDADKLDKVAEAIAKAVVSEITTGAVVTGTVTSGAGAGGAVTGTVS